MDMIEHVGDDLKLVKPITIGDWAIETGDELILIGSAEGFKEKADLFELKLPAEITFQRSGSTVTAWKKTTKHTKQKKSTVVVTRVITISSKEMLMALVDSLDDDWKVMGKGVDEDGLVLDAGDELLLEGAMEKAEDVGKLFEIELPAKLVFRKASKQSENEATTVTEEGHTVVKTVSTKTVKTIKEHSNNAAENFNEDEYYRQLEKLGKNAMDKYDDSNEKLPEGIEGGPKDMPNYYYEEDEIGSNFTNNNEENMPVPKEVLE
jgi:hypothetical protein